MAQTKKDQSSSRMWALIVVTVVISVGIAAASARITWGATKSVVTHVAASSTAVITDASTTVAMPAATSTPFNIYTRPTTPSGVLTAVLSVLAMACIGSGMYVLAVEAGSPKF